MMDCMPRPTVFALSFALFAALTAAAQQPIAPAPPDPAIAAALAQVNRDHIYSDIAKLVTFNNRSTLSSLDTDLPPGTGALAAADWVTAGFTRISAPAAIASRSTAMTSSSRPRSPLPAAPSRVSSSPRASSTCMPCCRGTDPAQAARRVLVTGHYDSRNSDTDEHARARSRRQRRRQRRRRFAGVRPRAPQRHQVSGNAWSSSRSPAKSRGSTAVAHLAQLAKSEGWQLEAVLNNDIVGGDTTPGDEALQDKIRRPRLL